MNRILSDDKIKGLAVTIFDNQKTQEIFACQSGLTLMKIKLKNSTFDTIPNQTLVYFRGQMTHELSQDESTTFDIEIDLTKEGHRFISLKPESVKLYKGFSVYDALEKIPELSDTKLFPDKNEFEGLCPLLLKKHAHWAALIHEALECGDFGSSIPECIKGSAYLKIFNEFRERTGYKQTDTRPGNSGTQEGKKLNNAKIKNRKKAKLESNKLTVKLIYPTFKYLEFSA